MNWIINFTAIISLSTLTGSLLFVIWYIVGRIFEKVGFVNIMYETLKLIMIFWFIPISYFCLVFLNSNRWGKILFRNTDEIFQICLPCFIVWIVGFSVLIVRYLYQMIGMRIRVRDMMPIDGNVYDEFCNVCDEIGISTKSIELFYDCKAISPYLGGFRHIYVALPVVELSKEQVRTVFIHELIHYKQKAQLMKYATELLTALHFFNPVVWIYRKQLQYWSEYACDYIAIQKIGSIRRYYEEIESIVMESLSGNSFISLLNNGKNDLESRIILMKRSYKMKRRLSVFLVFTILIILFSTIGVGATTVAAGDMYYHMFRNTLDISDDNIETLESEETEYIIEEYAMNNQIVREILPGVGMFATTLCWDMPADFIKATSNMSVTSGQNIIISAWCENTSEQFRIGILDSYGTFRYVLCNGGTYHSFAITQSGRYAVCVENISAVPLTVNFTYYIN